MDDKKGKKEKRQQTPKGLENGQDFLSFPFLSPNSHFNSGAIRDSANI